MCEVSFFLVKSVILMSKEAEVDNATELAQVCCNRSACCSLVDVKIFAQQAKSKFFKLLLNTMSVQEIVLVPEPGSPLVVAVVDAVPLQK